MVVSRIEALIGNIALRLLTLVCCFAIGSASFESAHGQFLGTNFITGDADGATALGGVGAAAVGSGATADGVRSMLSASVREPGG